MSGISNLKPWQPGQSGNPSGVAKLPAELRCIRSVSRPELSKLISKYARMPAEESEAIALDPATQPIERTIINIWKHAQFSKTGDFTRLAFLMEMAIGKVPIAVEDDEDRAARKEIEELSDEELVKLVVAKLPEIAKKVG